MQRDFKQELKNFCKSIDIPNDCIHKDTKETMQRNSANEYYNVRKITLPSGRTNIIYIGLTHKEAKDKLGFLNPKVINDNLVLYDMVAENATTEEKSVYYNPKPMMLNEKVY